MSDYSVSKYEVNGFTVTISYDEDPQSPHEDDYRGADMVLSLKGYDLPNDVGVDTSEDGPSLGELTDMLYLPFAVVDEDDGAVVKRFATEAEASACIGLLPENVFGYGIDVQDWEPALLVLPVYGYIHSGIALKAGARTYPFDCPWDSGIAGVAYVTPRIWEYCQGTPWTGSQDDLDKATALITTHVDLYGKYLNGECYYFTVRDWDGEVIDGCGGFYDVGEAEHEAAEVANHAEHTPKCTGALDRASGQVEHDRACPLHDTPLCCQRYGEAHDPGVSVSGCPQHIPPKRRHGLE